MTTTPALLVVGPSWVGDMVLAQSLFKSLKQRQPAPMIDVLAPAWTRPLLARMPEVRSAIDHVLGHGQLGLASRWQLGRELRAAHYQQAIVLPNAWKSALSPFVAKIPQRTGYRGELRWGLLNDVRTLNKNRLPMTVQRFVALGLSAQAEPAPATPQPALRVDEQQRAATLERLQLETSRPILALCPGAEYGPAKRWPTVHFSQVAKTKLAEGWQVWLFGSAKDQAIAAEIQHTLGGRAVDLSAKTALAEAIDLLSLAQVVVSNDSGLMHIAAAVGRNLVALYGSSDPGFTPPLSTQARILRLGLPCSPCFKRDCPLGHTNCLRQLAPAQVVDAIATFSA